MRIRGVPQTFKYYRKNQIRVEAMICILPPVEAIGREGKLGPRTWSGFDPMDTVLPMQIQTSGASSGYRTTSSRPKMLAHLFT